MPHGDEDSVSSCSERVALAARTLALGQGTLHSRLDSACETIGVLEPRDFPSDLRTRFAQIREAITADVSFEESVRRMSSGRASQVAEFIWSLAIDVAARETSENDREDSAAAIVTPSTPVEGLPEGFGPDDPTAGDEAHTDETGVSFTLKETWNGRPWMMIEEDEPGLPVLKYGDAHLGIHFRDGVPFIEAQRFAIQMGDMLDTLTYTKFDT